MFSRLKLLIKPNANPNWINRITDSKNSYSYPYIFFATMTTPTSRRKRPVEENTSKSNFNVKSKTVLVDIEKAVSHLKDLNPYFQIKTIGVTSLNVDFGEKGSYSFDIDPTQQLLLVISPISGVYQYRYDQEQDNWLSVVDNHDMRGLVTRDMLRHCIGCPKF